MESWSQFTISTLFTNNSCCPHYFSHYFLRLYNRIAHSSVQVLVTVVHLFFTSMFTAISNIVTPNNIHINDSSDPMLKFWYKDDTVDYGKDGHLILIIVVVGPILLSYMTMLVAGWLLMRVGKLIAIPIITFYDNWSILQAFCKMCLNIFDFFDIWNCVIDFGISWYFFSCLVKCQIFYLYQQLFCHFHSFSFSLSQRKTWPTTK